MLSACVEKVALIGLASRLTRRGLTAPVNSLDVFSSTGVSNFAATSGSVSFSTSTTCYKIRVPSAYDLYRKERNRELRDNYPEIAIPDLFKEVGKNWREASEEVKQRFAREADFYKQNSASGGTNTKTPFDFFIRDQMQHRAEGVSLGARRGELEEQWKNMTDEQKIPYNILSTRNKRADRKKKEAAADPSKKKIGAYALYVKDNLRPYKEQNSHLTHREVFKLVAESWGRLSEEEKLNYQETAKKQTAELQQAYGDAITRGSITVIPRKKRKLNIYSNYIKQLMVNRPENVTNADYMKELARDWKIMSEIDKVKYAVPEVVEPVREAVKKRAPVAKKTTAKKATTVGKAATVPKKPAAKNPASKSALKKIVDATPKTQTN